jgi:ankyrin repeat protein
VFLAGLAAAIGWQAYAAERRDRAGRELIAAVQRRDAPRVRAALDAGADPNTRDAPPPPPRNTWEWIVSLVTGRRSRSSSPGDTPIDFAVDHADRVTLKLLLEHGADPDATGLNTTPLIASVNDPDMLSLLIAHGARVDRTATPGGETALALAVRLAGSPRAARVLLEAGADPNYRGNAPYGMLRTALVHGNLPLARLLAEHGARFPTDATERQEWLDQVCQMSSTATAAFLLDHMDLPADLNARDETGRTLLIRLAARSAQPAMVRLLLDRGARVNVSDRYGSTALSEALLARRLQHSAAAVSRADAVIRVLTQAGGSSSPRIQR